MRPAGAEGAGPFRAGIAAGSPGMY